MTNAGQVFRDGVLRQRWDDSTRTYTEYDATGALISSRPYNSSENQNADATAAAESAAANSSTIGSKLSTVDMPSMAAILAQTNADLKADPSQEIKDLARAVRRLIRKVERLLDATD